MVARWWGRLKSHRLAVVLVSAALVLLALVVYVIPAVLVSPQKGLGVADLLKARNDIRATLLQALVGATLLAGLYFTARTFQLNREGQVTERFTRAIDQLGNDKLDVRLGGIYALERLAQSSKPDHRAIMEVLMAFVREHARWTRDLADESDAHESAEGSGEEESGFREISPTLDVQTTLNVLGRRRREWDNQPLDLHGTDLRGADLRGAHLEGAYLEGAHLEGANLQNAHLERANLFEVHLNHANLQAAWLAGVLLNNAQLDGAFLNGGDLKGASLDGASLEGTNLTFANMRGASLSGAPLAGAHLEGADFTGTSLTVYHLNRAWIDKFTKLPTLMTDDPKSVRILVADHDPSQLVAICQPGAPMPSTKGLSGFECEDSEFRDATDSFVLEDQFNDA
jgi:hypothetical protein